MNFQPITIKLNNGAFVEIGKIGKIKDYFTFETENPNHLQIEFQVFLINNLVTKYGSASSIEIKEILDLSKSDFDCLLNAFDQNGTPYFVEQDLIKLVYGLEIENVIYDLVELSGYATARHQWEAEKQGFSGSKLLAYLSTKEIVRLKQSDGNAIFEEQLSIEDFGELSFMDGCNLITLTNNRRYSPPIVDEILEAKVIQ